MELDFENQDELEEFYEDQLEKIKHKKKGKKSKPLIEAELPQKRKIHFLKLPCCAVMLLVLVACFYLAYFVYNQIKEPLFEEIEKGREVLEQSPKEIKEKAEVVKDTLDQGLEFLEQTQETVEEIDSKYNQVKDITQEVKDTVSEYTEK